jgi:hypothetical protein
MVLGSASLLSISVAWETTAATTGNDLVGIAASKFSTMLADITFRVAAARLSDVRSSRLFVTSVTLAVNMKVTATDDVGRRAPPEGVSGRPSLPSALHGLYAV